MRQASNFLQEKYKAARLALTGVSEAELLVEAVTDDNPWCPETKTMAQIAEATYDFDGYWKIVDLLHKRLCDVNWKKWRQSYNSLILLEFLITHGPEDFAIEFRSDVDVIKELGTFRYIDKKGVNWGHYMRNKTERILKCLQGGSSLQEVRSKAIKLTNEIQGFGSSSSSTSPSSTASPTSSWRSSFESSSPSSPTLWHDNTNYYQKHGEVNRQPFNHQQDLLEANSPY
uniref:ENTH domain-containing protein n=2 Tax=Chenopodium quinoa TaxID=63459 RepID=A0A803KSZ5_CHEQI